MNAADKETIKNVVEGCASRADAQAVAEWFSSSLEGQQYLSDMMDKEAYLLEDELLKANRISLARSENIYSLIDKNINRKSIRSWVLAAAAVFFPILFIAGGAFYLNSRVGIFEEVVYSEVYVPKGETSRILFQDGSEVFLNSDTRLRYPNKFGLNSREVELQGEAYFRVSPNKRRPFVVRSEGTSVSVLGTSFNVDAYENEKQINVVLDDGAVVFNAPQKQYAMEPGQLLSYNKATGQFAVKNVRKSGEASLWKNNIIHFSDTPLREAIKIMARRYNLSFTVMDPQVYAYSYTITTQKTLPGNIFRELEKISPVRFNQKGNNVRVSVKTN